MPCRTDVDEDGRGVLTIDDSGGQDAEVKVISIGEGIVVRHVFLQSGRTVTLTKLRQGDYKVRFALGTNWDTVRSVFARSQHYFEFGEYLGYEETKLSDGVQYFHHTTLPKHIFSQSSLHHDDCKIGCGDGIGGRRPIFENGYLLTKSCDFVLTPLQRHAIGIASGCGHRHRRNLCR